MYQQVYKELRSHNPLIIKFYGLFILSKYSAREVEKLAGIAESSIFRWKSGRNARIDNFEAALNVIGYTLTIVKMEE